MKLFICLFVISVTTALAEDSGAGVAVKIYDECSKNSEGFSTCLKKKAVTFLDRAARMENLEITEGITLSRSAVAAPKPVLTEQQLDATLPRGLDAKDEALTNMVLEKIGNFFESRSLEVSLARANDDDDEDEDEEIAGREDKKKKKKLKKILKKSGLGELFMMITAKFVGLIPILITGLFLLAKKALIISKVALLLAGIIALKKLFASKGHGQTQVKHVHGGYHESAHHEVHHDHHDDGGYGGGHGGWQSGGGDIQGGGDHGGHGGWDKKSVAQDLAYNGWKQQ